MRERLINRRQQGDLGEASAIEWLTSIGATVLIPFGHSPDYDLVAEIEGELMRIQVKTSVRTAATPNGHSRYCVRISTSGGNQSWTRIVKRFDRSRADFLFVLVEDGRRWMLPAGAVEAETHVQLGGPKYAEFEIEPGRHLGALVYDAQIPPLESDPAPGEYPSGQRTAPVKRQAMPSQVRILPPPSAPFDRPKFERSDGRSGQTVVWGKRRITLPLRAFEDAGLALGDRLRARADGPGRMVFERIEPRE